MTVNTLDEERTEVWTALVEEAPQTPGDPHRAAACRYLLRHLIESAGASAAGNFTRKLPAIHWAPWSRFDPSLLPPA